MPRPRKRSLLPACEAGGIFKSTMPVGVGVFTVAPRAASQGATGSSQLQVAAIDLVQRVRLKLDFDE